MTMRSVAASLFVVLSACGVVSAQQRTEWKFRFGSEAAAPDSTRISSVTLYSKEIGYGFEPGAAVRIGVDDVSSEKPFYFSAALPEGNYNVTVTFGDTSEDSTTTVKAELRRLMLESVHTKAGETVQRSFTVNVRTPLIPGGGNVNLKPREKSTETWAWDEKLTLEFNGVNPSVDAIEITPADVPTLYILGDSTVCDQPSEPWNSWGQMLTRFLKPGIAVSNQAESGESARSSLHAHRLEKVLSGMKAGDYLFVQYGHNDMKERGAGVGAFTSYTSELQMFVDGARAKGGIPVLITSMNRKSMDAQGHINNTLGDYPDAVRKLAKESNVALIDLNAMSKTLYEAIGPRDLDRAFMDGTHHNSYGSYELAKCVVLGIEQNKLGLSKFIADDFTGFDPAHPDPLDAVNIPASPAFSTTKPLGN